jgi:hypothetical protein
MSSFCFCHLDSREQWSAWFLIYGFLCPVLFSASDFSAYRVSRHTSLISFVRALARFVLFPGSSFPTARSFFSPGSSFVLLPVCCPISVFLLPLTLKHGVAGTCYQQRAQLIASYSILFMLWFRLLQVRVVLFLSRHIKGSSVLALVIFLWWFVRHAHQVFGECVRLWVASRFNFACQNLACGFVCIECLLSLCLQFF